MKNILVIGTGGTITMKIDKQKGGSIPSFQVNDLVRSLPKINNLNNVDVYEFSNIPSPYMNVERMNNLANLVRKKVKNYDGIIITHGTDTLEETAYFLDLALNTKKPVVLTAAMRSSNDLGNDGLRNIWAALKTVTSKHYTGEIGVTVVLNDEIYAARDVTKTYTSNVSTFRAPLFGALGIVDNDRVSFYNKPSKRIDIDFDKAEDSVALIKAYSGMNNDIIENLIDHRYKGLVIEAFGRGNLPEWMESSIEKAIDNDMIVVISSRCYMGRVLGDYAYKGGGKKLEELGAIFASNLRGLKARILLMFVIGKYGTDREKTKKIFNKL
ncbi:MAG: asparaginase [Candidatus Mcinerneyibacterium aminivorans]|uniref:Asparaginase n=1 Tax=Candidatus Mcinerneyibacterium aminivorans TaxID=2703815 RepID=A0A5D0MFL8_9BACT|nr:MAG: asparaginase [Candidatus Mcinerneyibacterium aminivorans]